MTTLKKFETGKTYYCRSACDHECIFTIEVVKRTEKTVTYIYQGKQRRSNIKLDEHGNEYIKPNNYSMAPVFRAERQQPEPEQEAIAEEIAHEIVEGIGKDLAAALVEYANLVKQLAEDLTSAEVQTTTKIKELLEADLPDWDEEDWEDLRAAVAKRIKENFYFTFGSWERFPFQNGYIIVKAKDIREAARKFKAKYPNDRDETVLNCSDYYSEAVWKERVGNYYKGREPYEVME